MSSISSWLFDIGYGTHICIDLQGLKNSRTLMKGEMDLGVGNRARVAALAMRTYYLTLPSGLVLQLSNCYFVPTMSKNIIFAFCLDNDGFYFIIKNNNISIYHEDIFYGVAILSFGLYVLNFEQSNPSITLIKG